MNSLNNVFSGEYPLIFTIHKRSCGKVMCSQVSVILFCGMCMACPRPFWHGGMIMSKAKMAMSRGQVCLGRGGYTRGGRYTRGSGYTRGSRYTREVSIPGGRYSRGRRMVYIPPDRGTEIPTPTGTGT